MSYNNFEEQSFVINDTLDGEEFFAQVSVVNESYDYYKVTPKTGFPFFIRYDRSSKKWKTVAEIYKTDPRLLEVVGLWLNRNKQK